MDLNELKNKYKQDAELTSALSQIESDYKVLSEKKESAVNNEQKLRSVKQEIAKMLGFEETIPANELVSKFSETWNDTKTKLDSFQKTASSKEIESATLKEQLANLTNQVNEISGKYKEEQTNNKINSLKEQFRKALNENLITDPKAVEIAINANLNMANSTDNLQALAKQIAEQNPFLTESIHKGGVGSRVAVNEVQALAEKKITYGMPAEEEAKILEARRKLKGS